MLPGVLPEVDRHYAGMQLLDADAILLVRRAWNSIDRGDIVASWDAATARILLAFTQLQLAAAVAGADYVDKTLLAQGIRSSPDGEVVPGSLIGAASDGRPLDSLLRAPIDVVANRLDEGIGIDDAMDAGRQSVERIAHTQIGDAGRVAAGVDIATRDGIGWTRMLNPPSCSRCVVLAGKFYRWNDGFDRHPKDDCVHVATRLSAARREGLVDDPKKYFDALTPAEQDKAFTKAGAQAIRDGADIGQVVNARRGMSTAGRDQFGTRVGRMAAEKAFGQGVFTTLEGTTTRGLAGQRLAAEAGRLTDAGSGTVKRISRTGVVERVVTRQQVQVPRLMPESIYELAKDRADALRLLRRFGYIR